MKQSENNIKLSDKTYWDSVLASQKLPRINSRQNYNYKVTMDFISPVVSNDNYKTLFEVGCGSSGWLPYFAKQYGLLVSGIDYSEVGCKIAEKNLELQDIKYGEIICEDLFNPAWVNGRAYDIIFSYGVVEHFEKPDEIVKIFNSVTNPGGAIITLVPNLNGLNGWLTRFFMKDIFDIHRMITPGQLRDYHEANGLTNFKTSYVGTFSLTVIPWTKSNRGILRADSFGRTLFLKLVYGFNLVITTIFKALPDLPSKYFSPYIICIAKKNRNA